MGATAGYAGFGGVGKDGTRKGPHFPGATKRCDASPEMNPSCVHPRLSSPITNRTMIAPIAALIMLPMIPPPM